jgi:16S rRNA (guanine(966)-N(2))-methyltransferase RsmD
MIRIITGIYKGRRLKLVPSASVRPMQDKVKGALFNILGDRVRGAVCLDGFAGTGSIGLEALSRGAATCVFVDEFYPSIKVINQNVAKCEAEEKAVVLHREFNRAVIDLAKQGVRFDIIFLDPPYRLLEERNPLKVIRKRGLLKPGGLIVLRHFFKIKPKLGDFKLERRVALGDDILLLFSELAAEAGAGAAAGPAGPPASPAPAGPSKPRLPAKPRSLKMRA